MLTRNQAKPGRKVTPRSEHVAVTDGSNDCRRGDRTDPRDGCQAPARVILLDNGLKFRFEFLDLQIDLRPLFAEHRQQSLHPGCKSPFVVDQQLWKLPSQDGGTWRDGDAAILQE